MPPHTPNSGDATADTALVVQQSGSAVYSPVHWRPTDSSSDRRQAWPMLVAVLRSTDPRERFVQYVNQTALRDEAAVVESLLGGSELTLYLLVAELTRHVTHRRQLQTHNIFFDRGDTSPTPPTFFGLKFVQKLVHCCNWLLAEMQCKIISVQHVRRPKLFKNLV